MKCNFRPAVAYGPKHVVSARARGLTRSHLETIPMCQSGPTSAFLLTFSPSMCSVEPADRGVVHATPA